MLLAHGEVERLLGTVIGLDERSRNDDDEAWASIGSGGKPNCGDEDAA